MELFSEADDPPELQALLARADTAVVMPEAVDDEVKAAADDVAKDTADNNNTISTDEEKMAAAQTGEEALLI